MKNNKNLSARLHFYAVPLLLILAGIVLICNPDSASALIFTLCGWAIILYALYQVVTVLRSAAPIPTGRILAAVVALLLGTWLVRHPLLPAKYFGRILGLFLILWGILSLRRTLLLPTGHRVPLPAILLHGITVLLGLWLLSSPLSPTRILMTVLGLALLVIGVAELLDVRKHFLPAPEEWDDPNIIDADE